MEATHCKDPVYREEEERDSISSIKQNGKASARHNGSGKQPDCNVLGDKPSITVENNLGGTGQKVSETRSG